MTPVRNFVLMARDLCWYVSRSGRWWLPVVVVVFGITALLAFTVKTAVPTTVYVLF